MDAKIVEIAQRIQGLREILEISEEGMADYLQISPAGYRLLEKGENDFSVTLLQKCAIRFGVDIVELLTGENPRLSFFTITKKGQGISMSRRSGFRYQHMAHNLKGKLCEPFVVVAPYSEEEQNQPIALSTHDGQEFDYILKGKLKVRMENHIFELEEGDAVLYDSGHGHGMIATGGADCEFLAVVIKR